MMPPSRSVLNGAAIACGLAVLVLSLVPERWQVAAVLGPAWFNAAHLPAYFILTAVSVSWTARCSRLDLHRSLLVGAAIYAFSLAVEFVQPLVGRTLSMRDLGLNAAGVLAAVFVAGVLRCGMAQRGMQKAADRLKAPRAPR